MTDRDVFPLPLKIDELDPEWLTAALRTRAPGVTVVGSEIVDVNHGTNTKIRVRLEMDDAGKQSGIPELVMLKGAFEPHSARMYSMYSREGRGYRELLPVLGLHTPTCYFAEVDPEGPQAIIIMDDLVACGAHLCSALVPQSFDQVRRRLSSLAEYHAKTWNSPDLQPGGRFDWVPDGPAMFPVHLAKWGYFEPATWQRFVDLPRGAAASVRFHDLEWAKGVVDVLSRFAATLPRCIVHGDTHLGNLYEDADGTPGFFDYAPSNNTAHNEITYHITCALDSADRARWEGALVQHYLDELSRQGVAAPGFDEMMHAFALFLAHGYLIFVLNENHWQPESINTAYTARFSAAMIDHGTKELIDAMS